MIETHISTIFFVGDRAYKLKKPVHFPFVDLRLRADRETICHREVELNRRLAPDVYLGVADVAGPDGQPCDHLVVMQRLPTDRRLSTLVAAGDKRVPSALTDLGHLLARFHADATRSTAIDTAGSPEVISGLWHDNFAEMRPFVGDILDADTFARCVVAADEFIAGRHALFDSRIADRAICDGHGDLQTDDVFCLDDGPRVLDCIEFCDTFRYGDVANDLAFLVMDLERLGALPLVDGLLTAYHETATAPIPRNLLRFYVAYRAQVRSKVSCLLASQLPEADPRSQQARQRAVELLSLCDRALRDAQPRVIIVGGLPGTGKSTVASGIGRSLGIEVMRSDVIRKELHGLDPSTSAAAPFGAGIYEPSSTTGTYAELMHQARQQLELGRSVVIDASFVDPNHRIAARTLASEAHSHITELRCTIPSETAAKRIRVRRARGTDASDADPHVAAMMTADSVTWPEATVVSTQDDEVLVLARTLAHLEQSESSFAPK